MAETLEVGGPIFASIDEALVDIRNGKYVIVMDDEDRENEGDLIMAAELTTAEQVAFAVNYTTGILCAPMSASRATELQLPIMVHDSGDPNKTAFTVSTDSIDTSTGVSAIDRMTTFRQLADPSFKANHFRRPGHIFPLIARPGGVLERQGHTEAAYDLCLLAGLNGVGLIGELVNKDGSMKRLPDCIQFAKKYDIKIITIEQLIAYRIAKEGLEPGTKLASSKPCGVSLVAQCELPISFHGKSFGQWTLKVFYSHYDGRHHVSLEKGDITREPYDPVVCRVHSECFTGDVLGSQRCDCGEQLRNSLELISKRGRGVLIYNVGHEGRGIGLANKILAYRLQQSQNLDTYAANQALGFQDDLRKYDTAKSIIRALGIQKIHLMTSNNTKVDAFADIISSTIPISGTPNPHNSAYLDAKRKRTGTTPVNGSASAGSASESSSDSPIAGSAAGAAPITDDVSASTTLKTTNIPSVMVNNAMPSKPSAITAPAAGGIGKTAGADDASALEQKAAHIKSIPINLPIPQPPRPLVIGVVRTSWNEGLVGPFTNNIRQQLIANEIAPSNIIELMVPGSFELPWAASHIAPECDAVICVGLLLKGETLHFEMISQSVAQGLMDLQLSSKVPMINAVLNCLTEGQAEARCGAESQLPGSLAATAVHMAALKAGWKPPTATKAPTPIAPPSAIGASTYGQVNPLIRQQ